MKSYASAAVAATFVASAAASKCSNITVPVTITGRNAKFDVDALTPRSNIDVTNFILDLTQQGGNYTAKVLEGYDDVSGTYSLATTYCAPEHGAPNVVQLLTHGIGFDRSYWDLSYNNYNYSYSNVAVDQYGFATFSWDRLGLGQSEHGEPVNEIQTALEVQALRALTEGLRAGSIKGVPKFEKVLHIGHSYGSVESYALTAMYPTISDGLGLTGFSQNGTFITFFELGGNFVQANKNKALADYCDGYLAAGDASAVQTNFLAPGDFDPNILPVAFATGQPVTVGELLTIGGATAGKNAIKAPVHIITGERDVPFCGGDCFAAPTGFASVPATSKAMFPNAENFEVTIIKDAGHALNLQYTAPETYASINQYFVQNGVGPSGHAWGPWSGTPPASGSGWSSGWAGRPDRGGHW